jgi:radical SAM protein with 4Fe4S-binding SPASM domain
MHTSPFIYDDGKYLYNLVTRKKTKNYNSDQILKNKNHQAIDERLFNKPKKIRLTIIPTWSCNLRCPYCFVLKKLKSDFKKYEVNFDKIDYFIKSHKKKYDHNKSSILLIGGEPLLFPDFGLKAAEVAKRNDSLLNITTNLSLDLTDDCKKLLSMTNHIQVSIDGPEEIHNEQRKILKNIKNPTKKDENVFKKVIENLKKITEFVPIKNILVATSVIKGETDDSNSLEKLIFILKSIGIEKISVNYVAPSDYFHSELIPNVLRFEPCCDWRYMEYFVVEGNKLSSNYFDTKNVSNLGNLDSNFEEIEIKYQELIKNHMPIMKDKTCLSCPALGFCWGQCDGHKMFKDKTPSQTCNQQEMIKKTNVKMQDQKFKNNFFKEIN